MNYVIRQYDSKDLEQVISLYCTCFSDHSDNTFIQKLKSRDYKTLSWKYQHPKSSRLVAEINGKIIGHHGAIYRRLIENGNKYNAYECLDLMVHPNYRRKGIATKIRDRHINKLKNNFIVSFPNNKSIRILKKSLNTDQLLPVPLFTKTHLGSHKTSHIKPLIKFNKSTNSLFQKNVKKMNLTTTRNANYLNWRLINNPINKYHIFKYQKNINEVMGYIVLKLFTTKNNCIGHIIDFLADDNDVLSELMQFSENFFFNRNADTITTYMTPNSPFFQNHISYGFKLENIDRKMFVAFPENYKKRNNRSKLHVTMLDHDIY